MFKQYNSYYLNHKVTWGNKLKPKNNEKAVNKEEMLPSELFQKLAANNYDYSFEYSLGLLDIETKGKVYSFNLLDYPHSEIIKMYLEMGKKTKDFSEIDSYMWLYIESDYVLEDPPYQFYHFFICKGDSIVDDNFSLSEAPGSRLPNDFLTEKTDYFTSEQRENTAAHVRLLYEKWFKETLSGRIYAMKMKMELAEETGLSIDDSIKERREIKLLRNSLLGIRIALYILVAITIYAVFIK